jgi:MFS family permease
MDDRSGERSPGSGNAVATLVAPSDHSTRRVARMLTPSTDDTRIFVVSFLVLVLAQIGFKLVWPFLPFYLGRLGVSGPHLPFWAGLLDGVEEIATALTAAVWGVLGDRYGRRPMVLRATASGAAVVALIAVAPSAPALLVLMAAAGVFAGVLTPLYALVAATAPPERLARRMGVMLSGVFLTNAAGPVIGGFLVDRIGFRATFGCGALFLLAATVLMGLSIREPARASTVEDGVEDAADAPPPRRTPGHESWWRSLRAVWLTPGVAAVVVLSGVLYLSNMVLYPVIPLYVPHTTGIIELGGHPQVATSAGLALGVTGVSAMVAAWCTQPVVSRWGYAPVLTATLGATALLYASMPATHAYWYLVAVRAAAGLLLGVALSVVAALVAVLVPSRRGSTAYGLVAAAESTGSATGFLAGGTVGSLAGLEYAFPISALGLGFGAWLTWTRLRGRVADAAVLKTI